LRTSLGEADDHLAGTPVGEADVDERDNEPVLVIR